MNLEPSESQREIAEAAQSFLEKYLPIARVRELANSPESAIDDSAWRQCAELGWLALGLSESAGGLDLGLPEEVMLFRELGRHVTPGPFRSSVLGARVAALSGDTALAGSIASGDIRVGLDIGDVAVDVVVGDLVLVLNESTGALYEVERSDPVAGVDPGARFSRIHRGNVVAVANDPWLLSRMRVLAAAEQLGIIEAVRDMSAAYARLRVQFGKPIGAFQAVKHRCADIAVSAYACTAELFQAALLVEAEADDGEFHAANAYVLTSERAKRATADNIQNHGGIGFTWEHDAHLYLKRAFLLEHLLGPQRNSYRAVLAPARHEF